MQGDSYKFWESEDGYYLISDLRNKGDKKPSFSLFYQYKNDLGHDYGGCDYLYKSGYKTLNGILRAFNRNREPAQQITVSDLIKIA